MSNALSMRDTWLNNLKEGDTVIIDSMTMDGIYKTKVDRLTKTLIIVAENGARYKRKNGRLVGGSMWSANMLREATPELIQEADRKRMIRAIKNNDLDKLPHEKILKMYEALR